MRSYAKYAITRKLTVTSLVALMSACSGGGGGSDAGDTIQTGELLNPTQSMAGPTSVVSVPANTVVMESGRLDYEPMNIVASSVVAKKDSALYTLSSTTYYVYAKNLSPSVADYELRWLPDSTYAGDSCLYSASATCNYPPPTNGVEFLEPYGNAGDYPFVVSVNAVKSNGSLLGSSSYTLTTEDKRPMAQILSATYDLYGQAQVGEAIAFNGLASYDPQWGQLDRYTWSLASKPVGSGAALNKTNGLEVYLVPDMAGEYVVTLRVRDVRDSGLTAGVNSAMASKQIVVTDQPVGVVGIPMIEMHSQTIDAATQASAYPYSVFPFQAWPGRSGVAHEKLGETVHFTGVDDGSGWAWQYVLEARPDSSSALLICTDGMSCTGSNSIRDRALFLDARGEYQVSVYRTNGAEKSLATVISISASADGENGMPMLGEALWYEHADPCISKELHAAWRVDPDGDPLIYAWNVVSAPASATYGFVGETTSSWSGVTSIETDNAYFVPSIEDSLQAVMLKTDTAGDYVVELVAKDLQHFSSRQHFLLYVDAADVAPASCFTDADGDYINDYHDTVFDAQPTQTTYSETGSGTSSTSCTAGSACVSFYVNRALWGF